MLRSIFSRVAVLGLASSGVFTLHACSQSPAATIDAGYVDGAIGRLDASRAGDAGGIALDTGTTRTDAGAGELDAGAAEADAGTGDVCCSATVAWSYLDDELPYSSCPPWMLIDTAEVDDPMIFADGMHVRSRADSENLAWTQRVLLGSTSGHVVMRFRARYVSGASSTPARSGMGVIFAFGPGRQKNSLFIEEGRVFLLSGENTRGPEAMVATSDASHDYVIDVDLGAGTVAVTRDGAALLNGTLYMNPDATTDFILWGEGSRVAFGESIWESFSHDLPADCST